MKRLVICFNLIFLVHLLIAQDFDKKSFEKKILERHNYYRAYEGVPPLKWSKTLAEYAQKWADSLLKYNETYLLPYRFQIFHSGVVLNEEMLGENIMAADYGDPAILAVDAWVSECKYYYGQPVEANNKYGHLMQVIWSTTREVGCAYTRSSSGVYFVVCNYYPPGNWIGEKPLPNYKPIKLKKK